MILRLDGSLVFLKHVFWVLSLNAVFILAFAFYPEHIAHLSVVGLGFEDYIRASHFSSFITTLLCYIFLMRALVVLHALASLVKVQRLSRLLDAGSIVFKVSLLVAMEFGLFPLICGWWLDICSLDIFGATLQDRKQSIDSSPGATMILHWLIGALYVFYFTSFSCLLKQTDFLWCLRNPNGSNPVLEMIQLPIYRHLRRLVLSVVFLGSTALLMLWLPIRIVKLLFPTILPYNVMLPCNASVSKLLLELLLLHVLLPAFLQHGLYRQWLSWLISAWTLTATHMLDLHSYRLGDHENNNSPQRNANNSIPRLGGELQTSHQDLLLRRGPMGVGSCHASVNCLFKIILMVFFMCVTLVLASLISFTLPVCAAHWLMSLWIGSPAAYELPMAVSVPHACLLSIRAAKLLRSWMPQGWTFFMRWPLRILKTIAVVVMLAGIIPLLLSLLVKLVIEVPLRVPVDQTPFHAWQDWALGMLCANIVVAITMLGPQWWLQTVIKQLYANGIRNLDLHFITRRLAAPAMGVLLLSLSLPLAISRGITPLLGLQQEMQTTVERWIYPFMLMVLMLLTVLYFQIRQFKRLYEHIKDDKDLVGQRPADYEPEMSGSTSASSHSRFSQK